MKAIGNVTGGEAHQTLNAAARPGGSGGESIALCTQRRPVRFPSGRIPSA